MQEGVIATIYLDKSGIDLNVGEVEEGTEPNGFLYVAGSPPYIESYFHQRNDWNNYRFPLGVSQNETNSNFARFEFELEATESSGAKCLFGFLNSLQALRYPVFDTFYFMLFRDPITPYLVLSTGAIWNTTGYPGYPAVIPMGLCSPLIWGNKYIAKVWFNASLNTINIEVWNSTDTILISSGSAPCTYAPNFDIDSVGIYAWDLNDGADGQLDNPIKVTRIKANSGIVEEFVNKRPNMTILV